VLEVSTGEWGNGDWLWAGAGVCLLNVGIETLGDESVNAGGIASPFLGELGIFGHPVVGDFTNGSLVGLDGSLEFASNLLSNGANCLLDFSVVGFECGLSRCVGNCRWSAFRFFSTFGLRLSLS